jgi:hypothetical protein
MNGDKMVQQNTIVQKKLEDYFKTTNDSDEKIFYQLMLYIFGLKSKQHDLYLIAKILPIEQTIRLTNYFADDNLKFPSKDELYNLYLTSVCYYLKCVKGKNWTEIKEILNLPEKDKDLVSSISLGYAINDLNREMSRDLKDILKQVKTTDYKELIKSLKKHVEAKNE